MSNFNNNFYSTPWAKIRLSYSVFRIFWRNLRNHKCEDEIPYLRYILKEDDTCMHIGATDGRHSFYMAKLLKTGSGRIFAFEPSPITFPILQGIIKIHGLSKKIKSFQIAISDRKQVLNLNVPIKSSGRMGNAFGFTSSLGEEATGREDEKNDTLISFEVEATTIDDFAANIGKLDFIRMDIEGSEQLALEGGMKTIERYFPHLLIEIHPVLLKEKFSTDPQKIYDKFTSLGYEIFHLEDNVLTKSQNLNIQPWKDYFFMHKNRSHNLPL